MSLPSSITLPREIVRDLYHEIWDHAIDTSYGVACLAKDPRDWHPDPECTDEKEMAAHADAVRRAEAGEAVEIPRHRWEVRDTREELEALMQEPGVAAMSISERKDGKYVAHVNVQTWGMGTSTMYDPAACAVLKKLHDAIEAATGEDWDYPIPPWVRIET